METLEPQVTGRRSAGGSFTIPEWCEHRRLSLSMYYKLRAQGTLHRFALKAVEDVDDGG